MREPEELALAAARWLHGAWTPGIRSDPPAVIAALALAQVCRTIAPSSAASVDPVVADAMAGDDGLDFTSADLTTALLAAAHGGDEAAAYLEMLAELVDNNSGRRTAALALYGPARVPAGRTSLRRTSIAPPPGGMLASVDRFADDVETVTAHGTRRAAGAAPQPLTLLIEGAALHATHRYDLPRAMRCVRTCAYLGASDSPGTRQAVEFIRLSHCSDGSFGDYESAFARLRDGPRGVAKAAVIKLHVTLQALWTLAELGDREWRLFARAFGPRGLAHTITGGGAHADGRSARAIS